jgi:hypothetical protein
MLTGLILTAQVSVQAGGSVEPGASLTNWYRINLTQDVSDVQA